SGTACFHESTRLSSGGAVRASGASAMAAMRRSRPMSQCACFVVRTGGCIVFIGTASRSGTLRQEPRPTKGVAAPRVPTAQLPATSTPPPPSRRVCPAPLLPLQPAPGRPRLVQARLFLGDHALIKARWHGTDVEQDRLGIRADAPREPDGPEPARDREHRGSVQIESLVQTEITLANDRRPGGKANLSAVCVSGEHEANAASLGLVEVIWVVGQEQVRRTVGGREALPVGCAERAVVDAADHKLPTVAAQP